MADWGRDRGGSRGRVETWDDKAPRLRASPAFGRISGLGRTAAGRLGVWAAAEVAPGRLLPWLPVAFGLGIAIYFTASREPTWWAPVALTLVCAASAVFARNRAVGFPIALGAAAVVAGFAIATLKTAYISHPVLSRTAANVAIAGFVEVREERERTDRIVVRVLSLDAARIGESRNGCGYPSARAQRRRSGPM